MKAIINAENVLDITTKIFFLDKTDIQKKYAHLTFELTDTLISAWHECSQASNTNNRTEAQLAELTKAANAVAGILKPKAKQKLMKELS